MPDSLSLRGELQAEIMRALWRLGSGTVKEVRAALPARHRSTYNTIQTVLARLTSRGLLARERGGPAYVYRPAISEAEHVAGTISQVLKNASSDARDVALARLIRELEERDELHRLRARARRLRRA